MRRNWLIAAIVVGVVVIAGAVVAARLADDDFRSVDTDEWAGSVCTSLSGWQSSLTGLAAGGDGAALDPDSIEEALDDARSATDDLVDDLKRLGPPDLETGDEVEDALDDTGDGLRESYDALDEAAQEALDAGSTAEVVQGLAALAPQAQALVQQARDVVASLQSASLFGEASAELEQAFADADPCQQLRGES
ncbi:MAG: hypothetical protein ACRDPZ_13195 [Gaiellaceae bacterium]